MQNLSILFLPLINSFTIIFFSHKLGILGINLVIVFFFTINIILSFNNFLIIFYKQQISFNFLGNWFTINNLQINWEFQNTIITAILCLVVVSISGLIHTYSIYYMGNDTNYLKFLMLLNFFTFFMLLLLMSSQLIITLIGWEAVGICSFLLINFWANRQEANQSALKAVLFNKIGDLGFILAILISLQILQDSDLININKSIIIFNQLFINNISIIKILGYSLILAAFGKSAQFFFHLWLTDAMEGPTPVSSLIHSATMVIAGVFLIIQTYSLIKLVPELLLIVMLVGTATTLVTSLVATVSFDIKRIIANSTASHIGLMFMALGLGDLSVSLFHLVTHAYFKAFGFLFAGYLIHLLNNEQDCRLMGGIFNLLPIFSILEEYWCVAMLNLPNSSSYYSKELFFNSYWAVSNILLESIVIFSCFLMCFLSFICSALYVTYLISWFGDRVSIKKINIKSLYESNWLPLFILICLGLCSQIVGFLLFNFFNSQNSFFFFNEVSVFWFIADWNEFHLLYSTLIILFITCLIDYIEDTNFNWYTKLTNYYTINYKLKITVTKSKLTNYWWYLIKRIISFSLDSLLNFSLYNILVKGLIIFNSIDNYLLETSSHLVIYKKFSFYLQQYTFNKLVTQLNINFILTLLFLLYILL